MLCQGISLRNRRLFVRRMLVHVIHVLRMVKGRPRTTFGDRVSGAPYVAIGRVTGSFSQNGSGWSRVRHGIRIVEFLHPRSRIGAVFRTGIHARFSAQPVIGLTFRSGDRTASSQSSCPAPSGAGSSPVSRGDTPEGAARVGDHIGCLKPFANPT